MGWTGGAEIFDKVLDKLLTDAPKEEIIEALINALEDRDWDTQMESSYFEHPLVNKIFRKLHPSWFFI